MRAPCVIRWPGVIKPGTVFKEMFASLDWLPTFVEIAGGAKGNELKAQIEKGAYPGIVKNNARRRQPDRLPHRQIRQVGARHLLLLRRSATLAVRYKNWKFYYTMASDTATGGLFGATTYHWTQLQNIMRDPFETTSAAT